MGFDTRYFRYAGTSQDSTGVFKARFANDPEARPAVLTKAGHTDFILVELPQPMQKLEAIRFLLANPQPGIDRAALQEKETYILNQLNPPPKTGKRGRPRKNPILSTVTIIPTPVTSTPPTETETSTNAQSVMNVVSDILNKTKM